METDEDYEVADSPTEKFEEIEKLLDEPDEISDQTTVFQTLMHFLKGNVGGGLMGLPIAVKNAGIVVGPITMFVIAIITGHGMLILVESSRQLSRLSGRITLDYGETAEECMRFVSVKNAKAVSVVVNILLWIAQTGFCIVYVLFVSKNIEQVLVHLYSVNLGITIWILILCPFLIAFIMIRKLASLSWVSMMANILKAFAVVATFFYLIPNAGNPSQAKAFAGWSDFPISVGVITFAFVSTPVVLPLENAMKEPKHFPKVVKIGLFIVLIVYFNMGFFGYLTCLHQCKGSVTLNLPGTPFFSAVKLVVAIAVFFTYFIQAYVPLKTLEPWVTDHFPKRMHFIVDTVIRVMFVIFTCVSAAAIPQLENIISLVGAVSLSLLGFVFPVVIHSYVFYRELSWLKLAKNAAIFLFGIFGCLAGTYSSIHNIIGELKIKESRLH